MLNIFLENGISIYEYQEAGFEDAVYDKYSSSDYIKIYSNDTVINLSNIKLDKLAVVEDKIKTYNVFNGLCCYIDINKNIERIYIKRSFQNIIKRNDQIVLDDEYFEKYFNTFSTNRMLTMQVLTPQVMEEMLEFIKKSAIKFEIIIQKQKIYFKFNSGPISQPVYISFSNKDRMKKNKRYIYYYYSIFKFIIEISKYLSNTINELEK